MSSTCRVSLRLLFMLALAVAIVPAKSFAQVAPQTLAEAVEIDPNAASHPLPHFWEKMFGSGRAILSLRDDYRHDLRETKRITDEGRAYLQDQFRAMDLPFVPSAANFVLVKVGDGVNTFRKVLERQIIVRALKGYNLPEWIRISVGTMEQNRRCIAALREVLNNPPA